MFYHGHDKFSVGLVVGERVSCAQVEKKKKKRKKTKGKKKGTKKTSMMTIMPYQEEGITTPLLPKSTHLSGHSH